MKNKDNVIQVTHHKQRKVINYLINLREQRGMSQKEVAERMGVSQSKISKMENSLDFDLKHFDLTRYANVFGVTAEVHLEKI
jgi:transcriptional regulator with XRE-family HTH domain